MSRKRAAIAALLLPHSSEGAEKPRRRGEAALALFLSSPYGFISMF